MAKEFEIENGFLSKYNGTGPVAVIPKGVSEICMRAFENCGGLRKIVIPDSVTAIWPKAFLNCPQLTEFSFGKGLKEVWANAFEDTPWFRRQPDGVIYVGDLAYSCKGEMPEGTSVEIREGTRRLNDGLFTYKTGLESVTLPKSLRIIGKRAFYEASGLKSILLPEGLAEIGDMAFLGCRSLPPLEIPRSVSSIGIMALQGITAVCFENSYAHRCCVENGQSFLFDYQASHIEDFSIISSPFPADEERPYAFVSYSHADRERVFGEMTPLYEEGYRLWYDEGLNIGENYDRTLEEHIKNCAVFLYFVTENSVRSRYILNNELPWAVGYDRPIIRYFLDELDVPPLQGEETLSSPPVDTADIGRALESTGRISRGPGRTAAGLSVCFDPARRSEEEGYCCCLCSKAKRQEVKYLLHEVRLAGGRVYEAAGGPDDAQRVKNSACITAFMDASFVADAALCGQLRSALDEGKDVAVYALGEFSLPESLKDLSKKHWLKYDAANERELITKLTEYLTDRGCRAADALPEFEYEIQDGGIVLKKYTGSKTRLEIKAEYGGVPVTGIGARAFTQSNMLTEVIFPSGLRSIGEEAFENCGKLTDLVIPESVTFLGERAFYGCTGLESVTMTGVETISDSAFGACSALACVTVSDKLTGVGAAAFSGCQSLRAFEMADRVGSIGLGAFRGCRSLERVRLSKKLRLIPKEAFQDCRNLREVVLPDGVEQICDDAFHGCGRLSSVSLPEKLRSLDGYAFGDCGDLAEITLPEGLTRIGKYALTNCGRLRTVSVPRSVREIGPSVFSHCSGLERVSVAQGNPCFTDEDGVLLSGDRKKLLCCPAARRGAYAVPDGVTEICDSAFSSCAGLTAVTLPDSVTRIGDFAFNGCTALTSCTLPAGVRETGKMLFWGCTALRSARFPEGLRKTEMWTFADCTGLSEVYLPASLTEVGYEAFRGCGGVSVYSKNNPAVKEYCEKNGLTYRDGEPPRADAVAERSTGAASAQSRAPAPAPEKKPLWRRLFRGG